MPSLFCFTTEVLARQHLGHVDPGVVGRDAVLGEVVVQVLEVLAGLQQGLGGDAADVGAGAARGRTALVVLPLVDAGDVHAELGGADGGDVAAGAGADDDEVEIAWCSWEDCSAFSGTKIQRRRYRRTPVPNASTRPTAMQAPDPVLDTRQLGNAATHAAEHPVALAAAHLGHGGQWVVGGAGLAGEHARLGAGVLVVTQRRLARAKLAGARVLRRGSWRLLRCRTAGAPDLPAPPSSSPGPARPRGRR
jgi:hypothetical protein